MAGLRHIAKAMNLSSQARVSDLLRGLKDPADERQVVLLTRALGGSDEDVQRAQRLFAAMREHGRRGGGSADFAEACGHYFGQLVVRFGVVDTAALLPAPERDEPPAMSLRDIFVAQSVRANPPPVELPRELVRRLVDVGGLDARQLPDELDKATLERVRQAYLRQPRQPVLEVLGGAGGRRAVVLGDPGTGKSSLARYLCLLLASDAAHGPLAELSGWLPVLVELRTYAEARWRSGSFLDMLDHLYLTENLGLPATLLEKQLRSGKVLMIFDGLDELFDPKVRETVCHQIAAFSTRYTGSRILVTSRTIGYRRQILDAAGFSHYLLQDLDHGQMAAFVTTWYHLVCPTDSGRATHLRERLLGAIEVSAPVAELAGNPMLLTILAIIGGHRELPRDRRMVYAHAVSVLVNHWDVSRHLRAIDDPHVPHIELDAGDKSGLLRLVARRMQDGPAGLVGNHLPGSDLDDEFDRYLRDRYQLQAHQSRAAARVMRAQFRERNFILSRFGGDVYGFVHRAFLEYLAADDIIDRVRTHDLTEAALDTDVVGAHWNDPSWHEVLVLVVGMLPERLAGPIIEHLLTARRLWQAGGHELPRNVLLALRCLGEIRGPGALPDSTHRAVVNTVITLVDEYQRTAAAVITNGGTKFANTTGRLFDALGPHWAGLARYRTWYLLHEFSLTGDAALLAARIGQALFRGPIAGAPSFKDHLVLRTHHPSPVSRRKAVQALGLGWAGDDVVGDQLGDRAVHDDDHNVRWVAVQVLGQGWAGNDTVGDLLRDRAVHDIDHNVRWVAVQVLGQGWAGNDTVGDLLRDRAVHDDDHNVRWVAVQVLAQGWAGDAVTGELLGDRATTDSDEEVRRMAMVSLGRGWTRDAATGNLLRERATRDDAWDVRQSAIEALGHGWAGDAEVGALLRDSATRDSSENVRRRAIEMLGLGWVRDGAVGDFLRDLAVNRRESAERRTAVGGLGTGWGGDTVTGALLRDIAVKDADWTVRRKAIEALGHGWAGDPAIGDFVRTAAYDQDEDVRHAAIWVLGQRWRNDTATGSLLRTLARGEPDDDVRWMAVEALGRAWTGDTATGDVLRDRAVNDPGTEIRQTAIRALEQGWAGDPTTEELLRDRARADVDEKIRWMSVRALGQSAIGDVATGEVLRDRAVNDPSAEVRQTAIQAVERGWAGDIGTGELLRERATGDDSRDVRRAAVEALGLGWAGDPTTGDLLREHAVSDPDELVRQTAIRALGEGWAGDAVTGALLRDRAARDLNENVRWTALEALGQGWSADAALSGLCRDRAANDPNKNIRWLAMNVGLT